MSARSPTEVLVVGAGPVGMFTALVLAHHEVEVRIIDSEARTATHSYACGLHPGTLQLLAPFGLGEELLDAGRKIETVAFYSGNTRQAEVQLGRLPGDFPFVLVLPQNKLEGILARALERKGVKVNWDHRLESFQIEPQMVLATIDQMGGTVTGYIIPHWERTIKRSFQTHAGYLVGADGHNSFVRRSLGVANEQLAEAELFVAYEFETDWQESEVRVVLDQETRSVLWPLPAGRCRWSFQIRPEVGGSELPAKDRHPQWYEPPVIASRTLEHLQQFIRERAPWFTGKIKNMDWAVDLQFQFRLARQAGMDRCWLVGDALHQTSPIGTQSMNVGLREAEELGGILKKVLHEFASPDLLQDYQAGRQREWRMLLGAGEELKPTSQASPWVKENASKLLHCIPASSGDLTLLLNQLELE